MHEGELKQSRIAERKSISLGNGLRLQVSYDELKTRLQKNGVDADKACEILQKYFPSAFEQEQALVREARERQLKEIRAAREAQLPEIQIRRWNDYLWKSSPTPSEGSHREIVDRVTQPRPFEKTTKQFNRVTDFSSWIFEGMHGSQTYHLSRDKGKVGERAVSRLKKFLRPISNDYSDWKLIDSDPLDEKPIPREIPCLTVNGSSLYGSPDYVYHSPSREQIIIVEVKVSNPRSWPDDGWPNLRAQLWAYGNIDMYSGLAPNIVLVGEIWSACYDDQTEETFYEPQRIYRWQMFDNQFCAQNQELFAHYRTWASTALGRP